jgi:probable HAF family extracellular repeat protein
MRCASACYLRWSAAGLIVALIGLGTPAQARAQRYSVTDLGTLGGGTSKGYGINASGQVTGEAVTTGGVFHAFQYAPGSHMIDLGTLGGGSSTGYSINASGQQAAPFMRFYTRSAACVT